jgi:predicted AlkP superfamily phosphohydrolase/phosphomutase
MFPTPAWFARSEIWRSLPIMKSTADRFSKTRVAASMLMLLGPAFWAGQGCAKPIPVEAAPTQRVILFSWDGAAQWTLKRVLENADLPNLRRLVDEGAWADGMVSSFPTKTAAAHAMLWTGRYGHQSGITANSLLLEPAAEHTRLETQSGYFANGLKSEPLWVTTARAGLTTYALHATQSYPYEEMERWLRPGSYDHLQMVNGYTPASRSPAVYTQRTDPSQPANGWSAPEGRLPGAREISLQLDEDARWGLLFDDPNDPVVGLDTFGLVDSKRSSALEIVLKPGLNAAPSSPIRLAHLGKTLNSTLRLFELDREDGSYILFLSGAKVLGASSPRFPNAAGLADEVFAGNGAGGIYERGQFGPTIPEGGDGTAEDRLLVTLADLAGQLRDQQRAILDRRDYSLVILYSPVLDDASHTWVGYLDPAMPGHDPELAKALWPKLEAAYKLHEGLLEDILHAAERDGANFLLVSDHGMAGTNRQLNLNIALERAGLLTRNAEGGIDLARSRALHLPLSEVSIAVNSTDRAGGIVDPGERQMVLDETRSALRELRDPDTGQQLITGIHESAISGPLQPGGTTTGDLFVDLAPGYYPSNRLDRDQLVTVTNPSGNHGFLPTRSEMLAICLAWGPDIPSATRWSQVRSIDIAPTVLELLGLPVPDDLPGRPLVAP